MNIANETRIADALELIAERLESLDLIAERLDDLVTIIENEELYVKGDIGVIKN